jgi:hypothetical protein
MFADLQLPAVRHEGQMAFYEQLIAVRRDRAAKALARRAPSEVDVTTRPREVAPPAGRAHERGDSRRGRGWLRLLGWLRLWRRGPVPVVAFEQVVALASRQDSQGGERRTRVTVSSARAQLSAVLRYGGAAAEGLQITEADLHAQAAAEPPRAVSDSRM